MDKAEQNSLKSATETTEPSNRNLRLLDFDAIRHQLANEMTFFGARSIALNLIPSYDENQVRDLQEETADACNLLDELGDLNLESSIDTSDSVSRCSLGGVLPGIDLLAIAESLDVHRRARNATIKIQSQAPIMASIGQVIPDLQELQRQIRSKIGSRGEVLDDATPTLGILRTQIRHAYEKLIEGLNDFIRSSSGKASLQDHLISVRGDRLVVPVKAEMRHQVTGIVHDASNTGATLFIEPMSTVELCNNWRELVLEEQREVAHVIRDLSSLVGAVSEDIQLANQLTAKLDFALGRARYSRRIRAVKPLTRRFVDLKNDNQNQSASTVRLIRARHPLLDNEAIPLSINIGPRWRALVITGPNTGGKTVAMKTVGLLALMHQSGIHIPAEEGSTLPVFDAVFADIGDQQSISDSVSTLGSHIRNVINILKNATPKSLVLLDELGNSTEPEEGAAIAKAIIGHLVKRDIATIVTTHHREVATFAKANPHATNASFQLDPTTLQPTYQLTMGILGRSYAMAMAERLGLLPDIITESRNLMDPNYRETEHWLNELQLERQQIQTGIEDAQRAKAESEALRANLQDQLDYLVRHRDDMLVAAHEEITTKFADLRNKLKVTEASFSWADPWTDPKEKQAFIDQTRRDLSDEPLEILPSPARRAPTQRSIIIGDTVFINGLNIKGVVTNLRPQRNDVEIAIGKVHINVVPKRLNVVDNDPVTDSFENHIGYTIGSPLGNIELDIRGKRVPEALDNLERHLDHATRDNITKVRIIHGRGTGALRQAVHEHLAHHPLVDGFGIEPRERGGNGATWVDLS